MTKYNSYRRVRVISTLCSITDQADPGYGQPQPGQQPARRPAARGTAVVASTGCSLVLEKALGRARQDDLHRVAADALGIVDPGCHVAFVLLGGAACKVERIVDSVVPHYAEGGM